VVGGPIPVWKSRTATPAEAPRLIDARSWTFQPDALSIASIWRRARRYGESRTGLNLTHPGLTTRRPHSVPPASEASPGGR
jgi:hypothetical protein